MHLYYANVPVYFNFQHHSVFECLSAFSWINLEFLGNYYIKLKLSQQWILLNNSKLNYLVELPFSTILFHSFPIIHFNLCDSVFMPFSIQVLSAVATNWIIKQLCNVICAVNDRVIFHNARALCGAATGFFRGSFISSYHSCMQCSCNSEAQITKKKLQKSRHKPQNE